MNHTLDFLSYQYIALTATEPEILMLGGIGTGKSFTGAAWVLDKATRFQGCKILMCANSYQQLMSATVKTLTTLLDDLGVPYKATLSGARKRIEIGKSIIYLYSLENADNIRGIEVSFAYIDEVAFASKKAMQTVRGRMRGKGTPYRQILLTTSPNSFNWLYSEFGCSPSPKRKVIKAKTVENTFLPPGYYEDLLELYGGLDSPLSKQELHGEFVSMQEGSIYSLFKREENVLPCQLNKNFPVYVGVDYNIDKMSATYNQMIGGIIYLCKEVQLTHRDANTLDLSKRILKDLEGYAIHVIADSTGRARKTSSSSSKSDHQIMREQGLHLLETHNPIIRDRQNTVNMMFHKKNLVIDPSCIETIKEIETLSSRDLEGKVCHLSVTVGYTCWKLAPLRPPTKPSQTLNL